MFIDLEEEEAEWGREAGREGKRARGRDIDVREKH